jgi:3-oxoacyl-[acyl-carrier protein] reductase
MDLGLADKVCVVTGATRGIGLEIARRLCDEGGRVLFVGRDAETLEEVSGSCGGEYLAADITDPAVDERVIATCAEQMGGIDVLVNNAGTSFARSIDDLTDEDWHGMWELNVMAPMRLMRAAAPRMAQRGGGRIVNVCSSAGKRPSRTNAAYSVTKAAQLSLSRVFADAFAADNILVNAVAPGPVDTPMLRDNDAAAIDAELASVRIGRFLEPDEIAATIAFLAGPGGDAYVGQILSPNGGTVFIG